MSYNWGQPKRTTSYLARRVSTDAIASVAATSSSSPETIVTIDILSGKKYTWETWITAALETTSGLNFVANVGGSAAVTGFNLYAMSPHSGSQIRHQFALDTGVAPTFSTASTTTGGTYLYLVRSVFTCSASGTISLGVYRGGAGTLQVFAGVSTIEEIT